MRRLLTWIAILMTCASLFLVGIRATHSDSLPTACIQLLAPTTGDVLTIDATTGAARLDARSDFPLPLPNANDTYLTTFSPDPTHLIKTISQINAGLPVQLWLGRRSTTFRRLLIPCLLPHASSGHLILSTLISSKCTIGHLATLPSS